MGLAIDAGSALAPRHRPTATQDPPLEEDFRRSRNTLHVLNEEIVRDRGLALLEPGHHGQSRRKLEQRADHGAVDATPGCHDPGRRTDADDRPPRLEFEDPFPILDYEGPLIPVKIPVRGVGVNVTDDEMILTADVGA